LRRPSTRLAQTSARSAMLQAVCTPARCPATVSASYICPREPIPPRRTTRCKRRLETMKFQNDG
jgi:hypothetical protein